MYVYVVHDPSSTDENGQHSCVCYGLYLIPYSIYAFQTSLPNSVKVSYFFVAVSYQVTAWTNTPAVALQYLVTLFREGICGISTSSIQQPREVQRDVCVLLYRYSDKERNTRLSLCYVPASNRFRVNFETCCFLEAKYWLFSGVFNNEICFFSS